MTSVKYQKDSNNIAHLILDKENASANLMDMAFADDFAHAAQQLAEDIIDGVIIRSTKSTFFAGGDINMLFKAGKEDAAQIMSLCTSLKASMRTIETCGKPVVACIAGAAMGGGWEIALTAHHRIVVANKVQPRKVKMGLPEVTLGLLPGGGGITRMVRLLGLQTAMPYLVQGKEFSPEQGVKLGLVHQVVEDELSLVEQATQWIQANQSAELIAGINAQPWDIKGYKIPGGTPRDKKIAMALPITPAIIRNSTKGTLPAPELIYATMIEGAQVDFDGACRIESRYFTELTIGQVSKNIINTFWYNLNEIKAGGNRPDGIEVHKFTQIAVLGAGMMGAGIAYSAAMKGIRVVLKDISLENAEKGKAYSAKILAKQTARGRMTADKAADILALIQPSAAVDDLADCEVVIEAVFESRELKATVTQEAEAVMNEKAIFASNTSTLPITGLAQASTRPANFIGMHFFSPVDKMQLVEIICGDKTSDKALAQCYDLALQLGKTPIVVNDSRGFYTSRVFTTYVKEGIALLKDAHPASIENAAYLSGFPVGPLAVTDEVSLSLFEKISKQTKADLALEGKALNAHPADDIISHMIKNERIGKAAGAGFYEYPKADQTDTKKHLWSGATQYYIKDNTENNAISLVDIKERMLFIMAIETARCVEEGVIRSTGDGNIGAVFGIGYPQWTGGTLQFINQYGLEKFITRAQQLTELYGERFNVPASLRTMLADNKVF
jgi:3-hydroxyacyl-CoA dehydrogenase/enoyl-CoA hydratase/3-hydroxybutyryl-CoA epimerase